jgi:hypothetical protein
MRHLTFLAWLFVVLTISSQSPPTRVTSLLDIRTLSTEQLHALKTDSHVSHWAELGRNILVEHAPGLIFPASILVEKSWPRLSFSDLYVLNAGHPNEIPAGTEIIASAGHMSITRGAPAESGDQHYQITKLSHGDVLIRDSRRIVIETPWTASQTAQALSAMDQVDGARWFSDVGTLTNWNRHISSVDIVSARDWIKGEFDKLNPTSTSLQKFTVRGRDSWNVIATFDAGPGSDIYVVGGHYDSLSESVSQSAPGAEDNATGAAGVLELARVFARAKPKATLIFIAFSGEEQGLVGSAAWVRAQTTETRARIKQVLTMDMIGYSKDESLDVLLETSERFKPLHDQLLAASRLVDGLHAYSSFNPFGSDHMSFINQDISAILTIDYDWESYPAYHRTGDTIDKVSREMGTAILKMNAGALGAWILPAPAPGIQTTPPQTSP